MCLLSSRKVTLIYIYIFLFFFYLLRQRKKPESKWKNPLSCAKKHVSHRSEAPVRLSCVYMCPPPPPSPSVCRCFCPDSVLPSSSLLPPPPPAAGWLAAAFRLSPFFSAQLYSSARTRAARPRGAAAFCVDGWDKTDSFAFLFFCFFVAVPVTGR